ncbi:MAG: NAD-dependent epimerase/dehydratase family protein [Planctomycetota bacterium]|nr:NAD-dependent epimerase/dehydratase family protein [Planctomycetota bacterium]
MRILQLGGTGFLGHHLARTALDLGHEVTLFHRGRAQPAPFPQDEPRLDHLIGDRDPRDPSKLGGLAALGTDRTWDAVIDTSGFVPRIVGASAELLAGRCSRYLFTSSVSVYALPMPTAADEDAPVATIEDETDEVIGANYGALKALSEDRVRAVFGDRALVVRPGLIVGPGDPTDRFSYWPAAAARGGRLLCPGSPHDPAHVIDARDLARWMVRLVEEDIGGTYNAAGPSQHFSMGELVEASVAGAGTRAEPTWVPATFLEAHGVSPWADMPCWIPPGHEAAGMCTVNITRAAGTGLACRPLAETARDTLAWLATELPTRETPSLRAGLPPERAAELLATWDAESKTRA